ncbi:hypothetical protein S83_048228, partial [Arachis hypogaea]
QTCVLPLSQRPASILPPVVLRLRSASCSVAPPFCLLAASHLLPNLFCFYVSLFCFLKLISFQIYSCSYLFLSS